MSAPLRTLAVLFVVSGAALASSTGCGDEKDRKGKTGFGGSTAVNLGGSGGAAGAGASAGLGGTTGADPGYVKCTAASWLCECEPGETRECSCGATMGTQTCTLAGTKFHDCVCPDAGAGGDSGMDAGAIDIDGVGDGCAADSDCGDGLTCLKPDGTELGSGGPPSGFCTASCVQGGSECGTGNVCHDFGSGTFCVESCSFGGPMSADKCQGRVDMACSPLDLGPPFGVIGICLPLCNSDGDCGSGLFCNPRTGLCQGNAPSGDPIGAACDTSAAETCRGECQSFDLGNGTTTDLCLELCTRGAMDNCGRDVDPNGAACIYQPTGIIQAGESAGFGDRSTCAQLCDCNADCLAPELVCLSDTGVQLATTREGFCGKPTTADGGVEPGIPSCPGDAGAD